MSEEDYNQIVDVFSDFFSGIYKQKILELFNKYSSERSLYINFDDLDKFDCSLADRLLAEPDIAIRAAEEAVRGVDFLPERGSISFRPHVRFTNVGFCKLPSMVGAKDIGKMICVRGIVTQLQAEKSLKPILLHHVCEACGNELDEAYRPNRKPQRMCPCCKKLALHIDENKVKYADMKGGKLLSLDFEATDDIVGDLFQDTYVSMVGIVRNREDDITKKRKIYFEVVSFVVLEEEVKYLDNEPENVPPEIAEDFRKMYFAPKKPPRRRAFSKEIRQEVLQRGGYRCKICGAAWGDVQFEIDHIIPVTKGGTNDISNLQVLCKRCNIQKSAKLPHGHSPPKEKKEEEKDERGRFDIDIITTGKARSQVERIETILDIIKEKTRNHEGVPQMDVISAAEAMGMDANLAKRIISELKHKGEVYELQPGLIALVGEKDLPKRG